MSEKDLKEMNPAEEVEVEEEGETEYITLSFDDGEDVEYEVVGVIAVEGKDYIVMIPETDETTLEVFGLSAVEDDPDSEEITVIEDDAEYERVLQELRNIGFSIESEE